MIPGVFVKRREHNRQNGLHIFTENGKFRIIIIIFLISGPDERQDAFVVPEIQCSFSHLIEMYKDRNMTVEKLGLGSEVTRHIWTIGRTRVP